jgi:hypothetical protein
MRHAVHGKGVEADLFCHCCNASDWGGNCCIWAGISKAKLALLGLKEDHLKMERAA